MSTAKDTREKLIGKITEARENPAPSKKRTKKPKEPQQVTVEGSDPPSHIQGDDSFSLFGTDKDQDTSGETLSGSLEDLTLDSRVSAHYTEDSPESKTAAVAEVSQPGTSKDKEETRLGFKYPPVPAEAVDESTEEEKQGWQKILESLKQF